MSATYRARGDAIDYTPDADVTGGDVVVLDHKWVTVARKDIAAGELGSLAVEGVFEFPKENVAFVQGDDVYWDETNALAFAGQGAYIGKCVKAADADDDTVQVKLVPQEANVSGTVTGTGTAG